MAYVKGNKVVLHAILGSDLEGYIRTLKQYGPFEDGSASCHVCKKKIALDDVRAMKTERRGDDEEPLYTDRTFLQKLLGKRHGHRIGVNLRYACQNYSCWSGLEDREPE